LLQLVKLVLAGWFRATKLNAEELSEESEYVTRLLDGVVRCRSSTRSREITKVFPCLSTEVQWFCWNARCTSRCAGMTRMMPRLLTEYVLVYSAEWRT